MNSKGKSFEPNNWVYDDDANSKHFLSWSRRNCSNSTVSDLQGMLLLMTTFSADDQNG